VRAVIATVALTLAPACGGGSGGAGIVGGASSSSSSSAVAPASTGPTFADLLRDFEQGTDNVCTRGEPACIDAVITEMRTRFDRLAARCDHVAPWALLYLRSTEGLRKLTATPGALEDPVFEIHLGVHFAALYFRAYDNWYAGRKSEVPQAWQTMFAAADDRAVSGLGNILLGINAHVSGDLPVALVSAGLPPDGSQQLPDFRAVNQIFEAETLPVLTEVGDRFDPTVAQVAIPGVAANEQGVLSLLASWREASFTDGERLSAAGAARQQVEAQIADVANAKALPVRAGTSYVPFTNDAQQRDDYCRQHGGG
jgi:hypothetical protein